MMRRAHGVCPDQLSQPVARLTDRLRQGRLPARPEPRIPPPPGIDANRPRVRRVRRRSQLGILGPARPGSDRVPCEELEDQEMTAPDEVDFRYFRTHPR